MATPLQAYVWKLGREIWPQNAIIEELYAEAPTLGLLPKDTDFNEDVRHIVVGTGMPQGVGPNFQFAKQNKTPSKAVRFDIVAQTYYALFSIDGRVLRQAKKDKAVIVKPFARESRNAVLQWKRDISSYLFGNGGGSVGQLASGTTLTGQTFVLRDTSKVRFYQEDMVLTTCTGSDGSVAGTINAGQLTVDKVVRSGPNKGTITVREASLSIGIPAITTNDFIFRQGVFANVLHGLRAWITPADPGAADPLTGLTVPTAFLGAADRTKDPERYAGIRINGTAAGGVLQAGINAASALVDASGKPDTWIMSTTEWLQLQIELSQAGKLIYQTTPSAGVGKYMPGMSYDAIVVKGPRGDIRVIADPDCPVGRSWMLQLDTWTFASTNEMVSLIESPMMEENQDSWESRFVGDDEVYCEAPSFNATIQHTAGA